MTSSGNLREDAFNEQLGAFIQEVRRDWAKCVHAEKTGMLESSSSKRLDILIAPDNLNPVSVECAFEKTPDIDQDAINRLGERVKGEITASRSTILTSVAVVVPNEIRNLHDQKAIRSWLNSRHNKFQYAAYSRDWGSLDEYDVRYPIGDKNSGYLEGNAREFIDFVEMSSTPDASVQKIAIRAANAVKTVARMIEKGLGDDKIDKQKIDKLSEKVGQPEKKNAAQVAACIWLNAMILHARMATNRGGGGV